MDKLGEQLSAAIRPTIALIFAVGACIAFFIGRLNSDQWIGLAVMVISYYFATKTAETAVTATQRRSPNRSTDVNVEGNLNVQPTPPTGPTPAQPTQSVRPVTNSARTRTRRR